MPSLLQLEEMTENHDASLMEMETAHNDTLVTLQEEHARTVKSKPLSCSSFFFPCRIQTVLLMIVRSEDGSRAAEEISGRGV